MTDPRDYKLDISSVEADTQPKAASHPISPAVRPHVRVLFECCNVYLRIYRSANAPEYRGACPKCGKPVKFVVGQGGTNARDFTVK